MPPRLPALINDPPPGAERLWLTNAHLFDGTGAAPRDGVSVLVESGRIAQLGGAAPEGATTIDVGGRTLMPGLIDSHSHVGGSFAAPVPRKGAEPLLAGTTAHVLAAELR